MIQEETSQLEGENPAAGRTEQREFSSQCRPCQEGAVAMLMENLRVNKKMSLGKYKLNDPDVSLTCKLESRKKTGGDCEERIRSLQE